MCFFIMVDLLSFLFTFSLACSLVITHNRFSIGLGIFNTLASNYVPRSSAPFPHVMPPNFYDIYYVTSCPKYGVIFYWSRRAAAPYV